jgi:hypothetical protein
VARLKPHEPDLERPASFGGVSGSRIRRQQITGEVDYRDMNGDGFPDASRELGTFSSASPDGGLEDTNRDLSSDIYSPPRKATTRL